MYRKSKHAFCVQNLFPENRAFYEIMWKNVVQPDRPQIIIGHVSNACWITKAIETYWKCVIFIVFPRQQWLRERVSVYCYTHIACTVLFNGNWLCSLCVRNCILYDKCQYSYKRLRSNVIILLESNEAYKAKMFHVLSVQRKLTFRSRNFLLNFSTPCI